MKRLKNIEETKKYVLLKDKLNDALINYEMNVTEKGEDILKKVAEYKKLINCFLKQVILTLKKRFFEKVCYVV